MDTKEIFSKRLLELREEKGISRQIAADSLQISRASLEYYEKGLRLPDVCVLAKIADYYCVSADYLLGRSEVMNIDPDKRLNVTCEYTGLSEKSVDILHETHKNGDAKILNDMISSFVVELVNSTDFYKKLISSSFDINGIEKHRLSDSEFEKLYKIATNYGFVLFNSTEVYEYWITKINDLLCSTIKEAFKDASHEYYCYD